MPENPQEALAEADAIDGDIAAARQAQLAGSIPPADVPLPAARLNALGETIGRLIETLTGGQIPAPEFATATGKYNQVPPDLGAAILAIGQFVAERGLEAYAFDPIASMTTPDGLMEVQQIVAGMLSDKELIGSMSQGEPVDTEDEDMGEQPEEAE